MTNKKTRSRFFKEALHMGLPYYVAQQYAKFKTQGTSYEFRNTLIDNGAICTKVEKCYNHIDMERYYKEYYTLCNIKFVYSDRFGISILK